jgi:hypothetical protein
MLGKVKSPTRKSDVWATRVYSKVLRPGHPPVRIVSVRIRERSSRVAQRRDGAQAVSMEVAGCRTAQHRQWLIYVLCLLVAGNDTTAGVCFFDEVVSVVGVDTRPAG